MILINWKIVNKKLTLKLKKSQSNDILLVVAIWSHLTELETKILLIKLLELYKFLV